MGAKRLDQIMSKVLTSTKCFESPAVFATKFCFADAEHIILLLLIIASREQGTLFLAVNNISTSQLNQTRNLEVDGCPTKENLFGQLIILFLPKVINKFIE